MAGGNKRIRKNRPRCDAVYICGLTARFKEATDENIDLYRCVFPKGHKVEGWKHEHKTIEGIGFDHNCECPLSDVKKEFVPCP